MLMAHGSLVVDDTEEASRYVALARAAISLAPIAQEASVDTVHALIMMNELYLPSHGIETESRWMLIGITVKITQRVSSISIFGFVYRVLDVKPSQIGLCVSFVTFARDSIILNHS